jgi:hypothetical protein
MFKRLLPLLLLIAFSLAYSEEVEGEKKKIIYITPGYWGELFAENNPMFNRDDCLAPLCRLREKAAEKGFDVRMANPFHELEEFEYLIVFEVFPDQIQAVSKYPKEKLILFLWEPPSVLPQNYQAEFHALFSKVYTWHDDLVDNQKYFKFHYPVFHEMIAESVEYESKKLATLIACNKRSQDPNELYSHRLNVIKLYEGKEEDNFDLYGKWWPEGMKVYKGPVSRKVDILKKYRFNYAYENIKGTPGYVTEKIFDTFQAGTVPIYWGASNVTKYVPADCFIDREKFNSEEELYQYLQGMSKEEYEKFLTNIRNFMKSDRKNPFTSEYFTNFMIDLFNSKTPPPAPSIAENAVSLYADIKDPLHPTDEDYRKIQDYLTSGKREEIAGLGEYYAGLARNFKVIGDAPGETPESGTIAFHCDDDQRENCVITYASFNLNYPNALRHLIQSVKDSGFKGHVLYRIGGWPNAAGGSLAVSHVPYAFKAAFFKEAERKGYKRVLWLDTSLSPLVKLDSIFDRIAQDGYFFMGNSHMVGPYINEKAANALGVPLVTTFLIPSCSSGMVGLDLTNPKGKEIADKWYEAAFDPHAYFSSRPDQNSLSVILFRCGINNLTPISRLAHGTEEITPNSLFLLDWHFAHKARDTEKQSEFGF